jgi:hypothetical protein
MSTLSVVDKYGKRVFRVHYINEFAVEITGTFVYPGATLTIEKDRGTLIGSATYTFIRGACTQNMSIDAGPQGFRMKYD